MLWYKYDANVNRAMNRGASSFAPKGRAFCYTMSLQTRVIISNDSYKIGIVSKAKQSEKEIVCKLKQNSKKLTYKMKIMYVSIIHIFVMLLVTQTLDTN